MSEAFRGQPGVGATVVFSVPIGHSMRLELLTFTLTTDSTVGVHAALVTFTDPTINNVTARLWDWNEGAASGTYFYTYGIGLRPFNCVISTGQMVINALPETTLVAETAITVAGTNGSATVIPGDTISNVVLYGELIDEAGTAPSSTVALVPGGLPGSAFGS